MAIHFEAMGAPLVLRAPVAIRVPVRRRVRGAHARAPGVVGVRAGAGRLSAADVVGARFGVTSFREGYRQDEVDAFLTRVAAALRERAAGRAGALVADDVVVVAFRSSHVRPGYDREDVDAFLDRVVPSLAQLYIAV